MKRAIIGFLACLVIAVNAEAAQAAKDTGIGLIIGEPTGFTLKHYLNQTRAVQGGLAFSLSDFFLIYADYLFQATQIPGNDPVLKQFKPYIGAGATLFISTANSRREERFFSDHGSVGLGVRIPLGLEWLPPRAPLGIFAEIVPGVGFLPSTFGFLQGGVGIRYYF